MQNNFFDVSSGSKVGIYQDCLEYGNYGGINNRFSGNIIYSAGALPTPLWDFLNQSKAKYDVPLVTNNLYWSATDAQPLAGGTIYDSVPTIADPSKKDALARIGFKPLPTDQGPVAAPANLQ